MDNQRIFLWVALALVFWLNYQAWVKDYRQPPPAARSQGIAAPAAESSGQQALPDLPEAGPAPAAAPAPAAERPTRSAQRLTVKTDVLDAQISLVGGDLVSARLLTYPVAKNQPDVPVQLLSPEPGRLFVYRTGLRARDDAGTTTPDTVFRAAEEAYALAEGSDVLEVPLVADLGGGLVVTKLWRFSRGRFDVELEQSVRNDTQAAWTGASYLQVRRLHAPTERSFTDVDSYSFQGPVIFNGEKYEKLDVGDLVGEPVQFTSGSGWVASIQHHFLAAAVPGGGQASFSATARPDGLYVLSAVGTPVEVAPGGSASFTDQLFVGPKLQEQLVATAPKLRLTVDYGWLTIISQPLFWLLSKIHDLVGNWGWSIIVLTILIKLAFYKLSETSGKSMAKMRKLQPRMKALQERYADDRQKLSQAMMELYKREKVNPASGCLPILVQMPVFLALYWVLLESVEMRQAPFMLWMTDLSSKDPYYILPLLMGVTMWIQQKLNPAPPDPVQAKVMQILPVVFTVFFAFFPAGLVLYWFVNNLLSILQQWRINRVVEKMG
jgi:YidC/Oxa1 family membrane protein insertase